MTDADPILIEDRGATRWIKLNRPQAMNAITPAMLHQLNESAEGSRGRPQGQGGRPLGAGSRILLQGSTSSKPRRGRASADNWQPRRGRHTFLLVRFAR